MYTINYKNGIIETVEGTLEQVKKVADENASYTQNDIAIENEKGEQVAIRKWWGVAYDPEEDEATEDEFINYGDFGYYGAWLEF